MARPFEPTRPDGRSDKRVIFDAVRMAVPETVFTFEDLGKALLDGIDGPVSRERIGRAVRAANRILLTDERRYLTSVKTVGYRVARADEHNVLAIAERQRSTRAMDKAWQIIRFTDMKDLTPSARAVHLATATAIGGLVQAMAAFHRRQTRQEEVIAELSQRVSVLEDVQVRA